MNIYEIAAEAQVSIATVSRVLNSPEKVNTATRKRVQEVLKKHNYVPNAIARGLVQKSMKSIGILASDIRNPYFSAAAYTLENQFFSWDYTSLLCPTGDDLAKKARYIRILAEKQVDGLVLIGSVFSEPNVQKILLKTLPDTPIAIIGGWISAPNVYVFSLNQQIGIDMILDHLCARGYENIYFLQAGTSQNSIRKSDCFVASMKQRNLPINSANNTFFCKSTFQDIALFAKKFLPNTRKRTAIIFSSDTVAGYASVAFQQLGRSIPQDVALVGYDNTYLSLLSNPQMTALDTKVSVLATLAATTLHDVFMQNPVSQNIVVSPELIIREST